MHHGPFAAYTTLVEKHGVKLAVAVKLDCPWPSTEELVTHSSYDGSGGMIKFNLSIAYGVHHTQPPPVSIDFAGQPGRQVVELHDMMTPPLVPPPSPPPPPPAMNTCKERLGGGDTTSGTYLIQPDDNSPAFEVHCDQEYDGGGWTRFNWLSADANTNEQDLFGQELSECQMTDTWCRGKIPSTVTPVEILIKKSSSTEFAAFRFDASNTISNAVFAAMTAGTPQCTCTGTSGAFNPYANSNGLTSCNSYNGCKCFYYIAPGKRPDCSTAVVNMLSHVSSSEGGMNWDDDTGWYYGILTLGKGRDSMSNKHIFLGAANPPDGFGEIYFRE